MAKRLPASKVQKFSQAQLNRYLANPRLRAKLPTRFLPADMQATRKKNSENKAKAALDAMEVVPDSGLTFGKLKNMMAYQEGLQYRDTDSEMARQRTQLATNQERDNQWFGRYQQSIRDAQGRIDEQNRTFNTANVGQIDAQRQASNAQDQAQADALSKRASELGLGGPDAGAAYKMAADQAANSREAVLRSQALAAQERARSASTMMGANEAGAGAQQADAMARYLSANVDLNRKTNDLNKNKADFRQRILDQAIANAQSQVVEKATVEAALQRTLSANSLAKSKLNLDAKQKDRMYQLALQELGIKQQDANTRASKASSSGGGGGSKSKRPRASASDIQDFSLRLDTLVGKVRDKKKQGWSHGKVRQRYLRDGQYEPLVIDIINDLVYRGKVSATNRRRLRAQGYKMSDFPRLK